MSSPDNRAASISHFGPMHGERTRRHQFLADGTGNFAADGTRLDVVVSIYERGDGEAMRLAVELTGRGIERADLTSEQVRWLRDACDEFLR